jgi:glycine amidinotransferase
MLKPEPANLPAVSCYNEWDPLEEVIVGTVEGACVPVWDLGLEATVPHAGRSFFQQHGGKPYPPEMVAAASRELDELVRVLEAEGVKVVRPAPVDHARPYATPDWRSPTGFYAAMPRDLLLVVGDEIIEAPMAWRCRYHEVDAYRPLLRQYFRDGARWTAAPRPQLADELYDAGYELREGRRPEAQRYAVRELEPTFDAADFVRCGRDLFVQQSHVTNDLGIQWLARHLGDDFRVHRVETRDLHPLHIDATFMPLAPGKLLVNPERIPKPPPMFRGWDVLPAPRPVRAASFPMCSSWVSMNVLMLDHQRVLVEREEEPLVRALRDWGFDPIPLGFRNFNPFGGSFHCATLDIRRRGKLESYF